MIYLYKKILTDFSLGNIKFFQKSHFKTSYRHNIIIPVSKPKTTRSAKLSKTMGECHRQITWNSKTLIT